jgi:hypothetical protein
MDESGVELVSLVRNIKESGPARVVVEPGGYAVGYRRALADYQVVPTVIFIRDDGWTLGAPDGLIDVAMSLWENEWVAVLTISNGHVYSYSAFRQEWDSTER